MKRTTFSRCATTVLMSLLVIFGGWTATSGISAQAGAWHVATAMNDFAGPQSLPVVQVTTDPAHDASPALVQMAAGKLLTVFVRNGNLWSRASTDGGATWGAEMQISGCCRDNPSLVRMVNGVLWLAYDHSGDIWYRSSADGGVTWTDETRLGTDSGEDRDPVVFQAADSNLWVVWWAHRLYQVGDRIVEEVGLRYKTSADGGVTWSADTQLTSSSDYAPTATVAPDGRLVVVWSRGYSNSELWQRRSSDGGVTWSAETRIVGCCRRNSSLTAVGGVLWLAYEEDGDILYRTSVNQGMTWSAAASFTRFVANDGSVALAALASGKPGFAWRSVRSGNPDIWFGIPGELEDINPPPYIEWIEHRPGCNPDSAATLTFRARALDETSVGSVHLVWTLDGVTQDDLEMYDNGTHGDDEAGDGVWGAQHAPLPAGSQVTYAARAMDTDGNTYLSPGQDTFMVLAPFVKTADILLVPDTGGYNPPDFRAYYTNALDSQGYQYDTWDTGLRCAPDSTLLNRYATGAVIWAAPYGGYLTGDSDVRTAVQGYLTAGGKLFITGQNIAQYLSWYGGDGFLNDYLHAAYRQDDTGLYAVTGVTGDPISDGLALNISGGDGANNQYSKDGIDPVGEAQAIFTYRAGAMLAEPIRSAEAATGRPPNARRQSVSDAQLQPAVAPAVATSAPPAAIGTVVPGPTAAPAPTATPAPPACVGSCTAGVRVDTGVYKVVYFAFGFEAINSASSRAAVMARVLTWLEGRPPRPVQLTPANGQMVSAGDVNFTWLDVPGATSYRIQIDTASTFDSPDLIDRIVTGTSFNHSFTALGTYYWRVQALPGGDWTATWNFSLAADVVQVTTDAADDTSPALVQTADDKLLTVFVRNGNLWSRASTDGGATWAAETHIADCCRYNPSLARAANGALWLAYDRDGDIWYRTSADGGVNWTAEKRLPTDDGANDSDPVIFQAADGKLWIVRQSAPPFYGCNRIQYQTSANGGATWSASGQLTRDGYCNYAPAATVAMDGRLVVVWNWDARLWQRSSTDSGATWSDERRISEWDRSRPSLTAVGEDLWLVYERDADIWYRTSANGGDTWSDEVQFTFFRGGDNAPGAAALVSGNIGITWQSDRSSNPDIWLGSPDERADLNPPPYIAWIAHQPAPNPDSEAPITFRARALDETGVGSVHLVWTLDGVTQDDLEMYDNGTHGDEVSGDGVWSVQHTSFAEGSRVTYRARATDTNGNSYRYPGANSFKVLPPFVKTAALLFVPDAGGNNTPSDTAWFRSYYTHALDALGYRYDTWDTAQRGEPGSEILQQYTGGAIIWAVPYWGYVTSDKSDNTDALQAYLGAGGRLFITGQNIAESLYWSSGSDFLRDYLHATFRQSDTGLFALAGAAADPIGGGLALNISGGDGANDQYSKDEIDPIGPAEVVFTYRTGASAMLADPIRPAQEAPTSPQDAERQPSTDVPGAPLWSDAPARPAASAASVPAGNAGSGTAGLRVNTGKYKVVYFAFGFEAINNAADRQAVMERVLNWLAVRRYQELHLPLIFAQPTTADHFWADRDQLGLGECTTLHWSVSLTDTLAVYLNDEGVTGQGARMVCPAETITYELRVVRASGTQEYRLTIVVHDGSS